LISNLKNYCYNFKILCFGNYDNFYQKGITKTHIVLFATVLIYLTSATAFSQSSDIIVHPTLTFYSANAPTVDDLTVKAQNIAGTITWYNQKTGGMAYANTDALDPNESYWAELPGASIGERLQTKIYFADTPVILNGNGVTLNNTDGLYYACEGEEFILVGDNLGGLDEFETVLTTLGFTRLNTGLLNGSTHFINNAANTWAFYNELINGDPNVSNSVGTPGVSLYMLNDNDVNVNRTENTSVWNAIVAAGLGGNFYWMGMSQFLNSNDYSGVNGLAEAEAGWFWEDGKYYDVNMPIDPDGRDWGPNEPNDFGTASFTIEEDKLQLRNNEWVDQVGSSTVPARRSGAIIEFNDASGIQWFRNDGSGWVSIAGANGTQLTTIAGTAGTSIDYRVEATFNGSPGQSAVFTVNFASDPPLFNIVDNDDANNPNEEFFVCQVGETQILKTDIPAGMLNYTWNASPAGIVNLTPSSNTVSVEGIAPGSVLIECIAENANGCNSTSLVTFLVGGLMAPNLSSPYDICGGTGDLLPTVDNSGQDIAWYATGDTVTELSGDSMVNLIDGQTFDVYSVIRDASGNIGCQSTASLPVTIRLPYLLETDPALPDPNSGLPGPGEWFLTPMTPGGNYDLRNLGDWSPVSAIGTNRYYTLFRGVDPNTLPDTPYQFRVFRNSDFTNEVTAGIQNYDINLAGNPDVVYATIQPNNFDCIYQFGPIYLRECNVMDLGNEITGGNEICQVGESIQLNADTTNLPIGYTILWSALPDSAEGNITFDDASASIVNVTGTVAGTVNITYTVTDPAGIECTTSTSNLFAVSIGEALNAPDLNSTLTYCNASLGSDLPSEDNATPTANKLVWFDSVTSLEVEQSDTLIDGRVYNSYSVRRQDPNDNNSPILCQSTSSLNVTISIAPNLAITPISDYILCDMGMGMAQFDLTNLTTTSEILGTANPSEHTIRYFLDANVPTTEITTPSAYTSSSNTIEVLVFNNSVENPDCEVYTSTFNIVVSPLPLVNGITPTSITSVCGANDMATIIADGSTGANYQISWTSSNGNISISPNPTNEWEIEVTALTDNATSDITYIITDVSTIDPIQNPEGCYSEYTFTFEINTPNTPLGEVQQYFCESGFVSDLLATIDSANSEELVWLDATYTEIPMLDWATTPLISGTIYRALARNTISGCVSNTLDITANIEPSLNINPTGADLNLSDCDDGVNTTIFNLTLNEINILGGESDADYEITYFTDAGRTDVIPNTSNFTITNSSEQQTIYVRAFTRAITDNTCFSDTEFTVTNSLIPNITVTSPQSICNGQTLDLSFNTSDGNYDYTWSTGIIAESISVAVAGTYTVFATDPITGCQSNLETIEVVSSGAPTIDATDIRTEINSDTNSNIIIDNSPGNLGIGDYEFALDNGSYQDLPEFENVSSGVHIVSVRDKNGCGPEASVEIFVFGFPRFFTPNNDGENEYWQVKGLDTRFYQHSNISVFNRYGKLLKVFSTATLGWDGTYNGINLPTEDYWYTMSLIDIDGNTSIFKGHFTLKR